jgi:uncharacterized membrane protein HdeD (DUF308 family)
VLASKTGKARAAILSGMHGTEDVDRVPVDAVGQAAAGGLLLGTAIVELLLGFWAAGWQHRAVALAVALVGVAFLASGVAEIAAALGRDAQIDVQPDRVAG